MLSDEVKRYEALTGESSVGVPISRLGGYLDGYEKGREDQLKECEGALDKSVKMQTHWYQQGREDAFNEMRNNIHKFLNDENADECQKSFIAFMEARIQKQIKEKKNDKRRTE